MFKCAVCRAQPFLTNINVETGMSHHFPQQYSSCYFTIFCFRVLFLCYFVLTNESKLFVAMYNLLEIDSQCTHHKLAALYQWCGQIYKNAVCLCHFWQIYNGGRPTTTTDGHPPLPGVVVLSRENLVSCLMTKSCILYLKTSSWKEQQCQGMTSKVCDTDVGVSSESRIGRKK